MVPVKVNDVGSGLGSSPDGAMVVGGNDGGAVGSLVAGDPVIGVAVVADEADEVTLVVAAEAWVDSKFGEVEVGVVLSAVTEAAGVGRDDGDRVGE